MDVLYFRRVLFDIETSCGTFRHYIWEYDFCF